MVDKALRTFEDLIRRSVAPTVTLFVVALMADLLGVKLSESSVNERVYEYGQLVERLTHMNSPGVVITLAVLLIIGLSYVLAAVQQVFFDNRLRADFEPMFLQVRSWLRASAVPMALRGKRRLRGIFRRQSEKKSTPGADPAEDSDRGEVQSRCGSSKPDLRALRQLREKVKSRLSELGLDRPHSAGVRLSDYVLYEVLGGIDPTDTRPFVDSAKALGIFFVSAILVLLGNALFNPHQLRGWCRWVFPALALLSYWSGYNVTAAQYRARALRLYLNFLAMPLARLESLLYQRRRTSSSGETKSS